jgi:hypothetical protein
MFSVKHLWHNHTKTKSCHNSCQSSPDRPGSKVELWWFYSYKCHSLCVGAQNNRYVDISDILKMPKMACFHSMHSSPHTHHTNCLPHTHTNNIILYLPSPLLQWPPKRTMTATLILTTPRGRTSWMMTSPISCPALSPFPQAREQHFKRRSVLILLGKS